LTQASRIVRDAIKENAGEIGSTGDLKRSIGMKFKQYPDAAVMIVGPRSQWYKQKGTYTRGKNKGKPIISRPSKISNILEKGSKHQRPFPFVKPAMDTTNNQFLATLNDAIKTLISQELASS
jgi:hypothetical protein